MVAKKLEVGNYQKLSKTFTNQEIEDFAEMSLDRNSIHLSVEAARESGFEGRVVHGALVSSLISGILGAELPGPGTIYLGNQVSFKNPLPIGKEVTASVRVTKIREDKPIATLATRCTTKNRSRVATS